MLVLTAVGAIVVFFSMLVYVGDVNARVGNKVAVLELTKDVEAFKPIDASAYRVVKVPERWTTDASLREESDLVGMVAATSLPKGSVLQQGMVVPQPNVKTGYREIAIVVDAETGVAGKVNPGDHVDIIVTTGGGEQGEACAKIVISNALVLDVGVVTEVGGSGGDLTNRSGVPVTFSLTSQEALDLARAESFSVKLRLALRGAGDDNDDPSNREVCEADREGYTAGGGD